ncbi:MAG: Xylose operon regulatory protein [Verrucomicrobiota bacterium]|jgi:AraC-like DNA-binding protein
MAASPFVVETKALPALRLSHAFRPNWEFYAVIGGRLAMTSAHQGGAPWVFHEQCLWIAPPHSRHSWRTDPHHYCEVVVLHFSGIPEALRNALPGNGLARVDVGAEGVGFLRRLHRELVRDYLDPDYASPLVFESALLRLSAFFLKHQPLTERMSAFDPAAHKVATAVRWLGAHLGEGAGIADAAKAMGITAGHLRSLFLKVQGRSPRGVLAEVTMRTARELLTDRALSMKEVAARCGFRAYSQFYRAFVRHHGMTPTAWIEGAIYGAAKEPLQSAVARLRPPAKRSERPGGA